MMESKLMGVAKGVGASRIRAIVASAHEKPLQLFPDNPALHLIQQVRDQEHRFAISGHAPSAVKAQPPCWKISGVGGAAGGLCSNGFGGLQGVYQASLEELALVEGVSLSLAEKIMQQLH
ncbi:MAG: hypothetical protein IPN81_01675 [Nitrosomonadales bacterium]|nr:hypothetical protein [Nitrosomonadales bacterium]